MEQTRQNCNGVEFLLDGDAYFAKLHARLEAVRAAGAGNNRCVRLAFWQMSPDTFLPATGQLQGRYLCDLLETIALLGTPVQLIVWYGTYVVNIFNDEMSSNWAMKKWVDATNAAHANTHGYQAISIFMETYGGRTNVGMSTHQKIAVIADGVNKDAFVGGMNLAQKYLSANVHDPVNSWHDTAVRVTGTIVNDIEGEWLRRWRKQTNPPAPNQAVGNAGPILNGVTITMLTTNIEVNPAENSIRDKMVTRIQNATDFIFLENYALTDPRLISELAARKRAGIAVIPVVNHPKNKTQEGFEIFSYLMFYTFVELGLSDFTSFGSVDTWKAFFTKSPITHNAVDVVNPVVRKNGFDPAKTAKNNPVNSFCLNYETQQHAPKSAMFRDIWTINTNNPVMYAPKNNHAIVSDTWTYLHSKLAMFDDRYVLIGTSNWTYRSMQYDGEITLEIDDASNAIPQQIRQNLFTHWSMPTAANSATNAVGADWVIDANANPARLGSGANARVVPLVMNDFLHPSSFEAWKKYKSTPGALISAYL